MSGIVAGTTTPSSVRSLDLPRSPAAPAAATPAGTRDHAFGVAQLLIGAIWFVRTRALRRLVTTRPGTVAATGLLGATAVAALAGAAP